MGTTPTGSPQKASVLVNKGIVGFSIEGGDTEITEGGKGFAGQVDLGLPKEWKNWTV